MSNSGLDRDVSKLPSEQFELADKYWNMEATEAKVNLQERTKELGAITRANELFGSGSAPIKQHIATYVDEIPAWFQYPEVTEAQIAVGTTVAESTNFHRTSHPLTKDSITESGTRVTLEVVYTDARPDEDDGPWLDEEHNLLETIIAFITNYKERKENEREMQQQLTQQQNVAQQVEDGVRKVKQSANEVKEKTTKIDDHANTSSDSMSEVSNEIADMSATIEEIASTAEEVAQVSENAHQLSEQGTDAATEAIEVMSSVDESTQEVSEDVDSLRKRVDEIDGIVEVINGIADQTNILALNASIEAARAGEAGSGFAVVADEVKSLAGDSQTHANEIEKKIKMIKNDTNNTVDSLNTTKEQVAKGINKVEGAMTTLEDIANAVEETSQGIREVSNATDSQAVSTEEIAGMVNEQVSQSETVADEISIVASASEKQIEDVEEIDRTVDQLV